MLTQGIIILISDDKGQSYEAIGCITGFSLERAEKNEIDTTCLDSNEKTFEFGLMDSGTLSVDVNLDFGNAGYKMVEESYEDSKSTRTFQIQYTDTPDVGGTPTIKEFDGYVTSLSETAELDGILTGSFSVRINGAITVTDPVVP